MSGATWLLATSLLGLMPVMAFILSVPQSTCPISVPRSLLSPSREEDMIKTLSAVKKAMELAYARLGKTLVKRPPRDRSNGSKLRKRSH